MVGEDENSFEALGRAHWEYLEAGEKGWSVRSAFYLGLALILRGESARGSGWLARAQRVLDDMGECPEQGYMLVPAAIQMRTRGEYEQAAKLAAEAADLGDRHADADLVTLARIEEGLARLKAGQVTPGLVLLDETMVTVMADALSPIVTGMTYCSVIEECHRMFVWNRAADWTLAMSGWCERQPDLVAFTGQCLTDRSEVMQHRGEWESALLEAERACERFAMALDPAPAGRGHYQRGEIHRLQGRFAAAEEAYREASRFGSHPQPGLALLRLAQGAYEAADASIRRALAETTDPLERGRLLPAFVEVMLTVDDLDRARAGCQELKDLAADWGLDILEAQTAHAMGSLALAEGEASNALVSLRRAWRLWHDLGAPYESAQSQTRVGIACRELGDSDGAAFELRAARDSFARLGARSEQARVDALLAGEERRDELGLTDREREVLARVASGKANKQIAADLMISVRTIDRHVSNIFTKLGVESRTAAAAYAHRHNLV